MDLCTLKDLPGFLRSKGVRVPQALALYCAAYCYPNPGGQGVSVVKGIGDGGGDVITYVGRVSAPSTDLATLYDAVLVALRIAKELGVGAVVRLGVPTAYNQLVGKWRVRNTRLAECVGHVRNYERLVPVRYELVSPKDTFLRLAFTLAKKEHPRFREPWKLGRTVLTAKDLATNAEAIRHTYARFRREVEEGRSTPEVLYMVLRATVELIEDEYNIGFSSRLERRIKSVLRGMVDTHVCPAQPERTPRKPEPEVMYG